MAESLATPHLNLTRSLYKVTDFLSWARNSELQLSASFQRRPVWQPSAKSYFIDTVVRGLPIPIVFFREITDLKLLKTVRQAVDGQQRIRTLISFIDPTLLKDYRPEQDDFKVKKTHNAELAGKSFSELSDRVQSLILNYEIATHILPPDTSDQQVLDIFRRMNATGTKLNEQELRNAEFFGEFIQSVYGMSLQFLDYWRRWRLFTEYDIARMEEAEFLSELYIVALRGISEKTQKNISDVYSDYDVNFKERFGVERRVATVLNSIDGGFDVGVAATPFKNKILFYALFAAVYNIMYGLGSPLEGSVKAAVSAQMYRRALGAAVKLDRRQDLPAAVLEALLSRSNRKSNRVALYDFISEAMQAQ